MTKVIATVKAIITRLIFSAHSFIAIWQVTQSKKDPLYWSLSTPLGILFFEGLFTLAIKKNQEWRWFCPSVFLYLSGVVPAIWLLELNKVEHRNKIKEETVSLQAVGKDLENLDKLLGVKIKLPDLKVDAEMWVTLIEQFLMLILIIGRWLLPKGDLTRDQLSQLLLVYIGTAADIIEFFDSFKDPKIHGDQVLMYLTLGIWSWSLIQFTIVLSATRSRKPRGGGSKKDEEDLDNCCGGCCCGIDAWGIALNIILQDAPFLTFRLLIIIQYKIVSYMNVFFTCKNTLVILLQLYRLYVVYTESHKTKKQSRKKALTEQSRNRHEDVYMISNGRYENHHQQHRKKRIHDDYDEICERKNKRRERARKDTGYSTASSNENRHRIRDKVDVGEKSRKKRQSSSEEESECNEKRSGSDKKRHKIAPVVDKSRKKSSKQSKKIIEVTEESDTSTSTSSSSESKKPNKSSKRQKKKKRVDSSKSSD